MKSSLTVCYVNSRLRRTLVNHRLLTVRLSVLALKLKVSLYVNPVVKVNSVIAGLNLNHLKQVVALSSKAKLSVVQFLVNTSLQFKLVSKSQ
ncbi:hypothetical protein D3C78_1146900 [compost metagenome]